MRAARSWIPLLVVLVAGCADSPAALPVTGPRVAALELAVDSLLILDVGEERVVSGEARLSDGTRRAFQAPVWSSGQPEVAEVQGGRVHAKRSGYARIAVRESGAEASFWVAVRYAPSRFSLELVFDADVPEAWRLALGGAAERWREVIREPLAPFVVPGGPRVCGPESDPASGEVVEGTIVYVRTFTTTPFSAYPEAVGGPCLQRPLPTPSSVTGVVSVQPSVVHGMSPERLGYVAQHELGHALGLVGVIQGFQPEWFDPLTGIYTASGALEGYFRDTGAQVDRLLVHTTAHWTTSGDVMSTTDYFEGIRHISIGALRDLGYSVDWHAAGPYLLR